VDYQEGMLRKIYQANENPRKRPHFTPPDHRIRGTRPGAKYRHPSAPVGAGAKEVESADKPGSVWDDHSSGMPVTGHLKRPTRRHLRAAGCQRHASLFGLAPEGVYRAAHVTADAVRSYRTLSPLPATGTNPETSAVCFLLHFPSTHAAQALPGLLPCGARTFLRRLAATAIVWPTPRSTVGQAHPAGKPVNAPPTPVPADTDDSFSHH